VYVSINSSVAERLGVHGYCYVLFQWRTISGERLRHSQISTVFNFAFKTCSVGDSIKRKDYLHEHVPTTRHSHLPFLSLSLSESQVEGFAYICLQGCGGGEAYSNGSRKRVFVKYSW
jgi:hypothetical protein